MFGPEKAATPAAKVEKKPWPTGLPEQVAAVRQALRDLGTPADVETVAACFKRMTKQRKARLAELLETLTSLAQARATGDGRYPAE